MSDAQSTTRQPRPAAMALAKAFDGGMTLDDLRELNDEDLARFQAVMFNWQELAVHETDRRRRAHR
jgi:hypothetical protein